MSSDAATECTNSTTQCVQGECASNNAIRYNYFGTAVGASLSSCLESLGGNAQGLKKWAFYGNVFNDCIGGNGVITTGNGADVGLVNVHVYNRSYPVIR